MHCGSFPGDIFWHGLRTNSFSASVNFLTATPGKELIDYATAAEPVSQAGALYCG
jgi:hypothetical protein